MNWFHIRIIVLLLLLSALDGYDILAMAFAAPAITAEWGIGKAELGIVLSAGLAGMAIGGLVIAPFADVIGRKTIFLPSLVLMTLGMLLSAQAESLGAMSLWRVVTGMGIGSCGALLNSFAAEFAPPDRRPLVISIMVVGFPAGGMLGGVASSFLLQIFGWPAIFVAGAVAALILLPMVVLWLPESPAFLRARPTSRNRAALKATLEKLGLPDVPSTATGPGVPRRGYAFIFAPAMIRTTLWIMLINALQVLTIFYVLSWLPQMVAEAGFAASQASLVSALLNFAGILGGLSFGWLGQRYKVQFLTAGSLFAFGTATIAFGFAQPSLPILMLAAAVCGVFLFGSTCSLYATIAQTFPDEARASGIGFVGGVGRIFSAIAPLLAGQLFAAGFDRAETAITFGTCSVVAAITTMLGLRSRRQMNAGSPPSMGIRDLSPGVSHAIDQK